SRVKFDERGDRSSKVEFYQLRNVTRDLVAKYDPISRRISWIKELWFSGGSPPVDEPQVEILSLLIGRPAAISIISVSSLGMALSVAAVAVNFHYRKLRLIKMSSPLVNNVIGAGCLMCYASCIVMAANSQWSTSAL
uniref:G_PROTEIN_RECEP_F3_4 domain-containing protein n=1 Tax=Macrostomum lignano TaxID=282301 RepID=A0A1I8G6V1_9PLAT